MQDLVALGTGNSRLMKSNIPANTTLAQFIQMLNNGTFPYDIGPLNPAGISQEGTPLNKGTLLKDTTAALFGLGASNVPNDALAFLGKYNQHWWICRSPSRTGYIEKLTPVNTTNQIIMYITAREYLQYSKSLTINQTTGAVSLKNPSYYYPSGGNPSNGAFLDLGSASNSIKALIDMAPVYVKGLNGDKNNIYFLPAGSTLQRTYGGSYTVIIGSDGGDDEWYYPVIHYHTGNQASVRASIVSSQSSLIPAGEASYTWSTNRNAYPDNGMVGELLYTYLGRPFDNIVAAPKIETGSYVGTGTYGSGNLNSLTFGFVPKLLLVSYGTSGLQPNGGYWQNCFIWFTGNKTVLSGGASYSNTFSSNGNTISWYGSNANGQCNISGATYNYIAIG